MFGGDFLTLSKQAGHKFDWTNIIKNSIFISKAKYFYCPLNWFFKRLLNKTKMLRKWKNRQVKKGHTTTQIRMLIKCFIIYYYILPRKPLNRNTLGQRPIDFNNQLIIVSKWASTYIRYERIIDDLSSWMKMIPLTDGSHDLWSH